MLPVRFKVFCLLLLTSIAHAGDPMDQLVAEATPFVTTLSRAVEVYHYAPGEDDMAGYLDPGTGRGAAILDSVVQHNVWDEDGNSGPFKNRLGYGVYASPDPFSSKGYGGEKTWILFQIHLPKGSRLLDATEAAKDVGEIQITEALRVRLREAKCWASRFYDIFSRAECRTIAADLLRRLDLVGVRYRFGDSNSAICAGHHNSTAFYLAPARGFAPRDVRILSAVLPPSGKDVASEDRVNIQRFVNLWPSLKLPDDAATRQAYAEKHFLGCGQEIDDGRNPAVLAHEKTFRDLGVKRTAIEKVITQGVINELTSRRFEWSRESYAEGYCRRLAEPLINGMDVQAAGSDYFPLADWVNPLARKICDELYKELSPGAKQFQDSVKAAGDAVAAKLLESPRWVQWSFEQVPTCEGRAQSFSIAEVARLTTPAYLRDELVDRVSKSACEQIRAKKGEELGTLTATRDRLFTNLDAELFLNLDWLIRDEQQSWRRRERCQKRAKPASYAFLTDPAEQATLVALQYWSLETLATVWAGKACDAKVK